ncbi:MAG: GNAT family N-acetyltransferase [Acidimicrobiales bacterium]|nr:GNAT family N-acetyltransferase [Acidimicrobiales bacterium]
MTPALPDGWTWRRPADPEDDAAAVFALVAACNEAVIGVADWTLDDAVEQLGEPGFDAERDGWLVVDADGALVGFGCVQHEGDDQVGAEVFALDDQITQWLLGEVTARADELARSAGHRAATIIFGVYRQDEARRALLTEHGYESATTFHRMRIDHDAAASPVEPPAAPAGVVVRQGPGDEAFRRTAHEIKEASFRDHFGHVVEPYERWHAQVEASPTRDWEQLWVADVDGTPAAMLHAHDGFLADEDCGYVSHVGVLPEFRGRGLAKLLLHTAFASDAARARAGTLLHVDTNNTTPALDLYLDLGMRPVLVIDAWRRPGT